MYYVGKGVKIILYYLLIIRLFIITIILSNLLTYKLASCAVKNTNRKN